MATTEPLTGVTVQDQSDAATGGAQIGNVAKRIAGFTVPRFTTTSTRDTAYSAFVSGGGTMADGMMCTVAGTPYRRIGGTWRIDRNRIIARTGAPGTTIAAGGGNETSVTVGIAGLPNFTLYEASTVSVRGLFRAGGAGIAQCGVKIDGALVGRYGISRDDGTVPCGGTLALAAGSHVIQARVDNIGASGDISWTEFTIDVIEGTAE